MSLKKQILVVEDNQINREMLRMILSGQYDVTEADSGQTALNLLWDRKDDIALILLDVMMPVMDGYEACRAIRAMERADAAAIPIVAMTANAFSEDIWRSLDAGMNAHISKPFDVNKLKQSLAKL